MVFFLHIFELELVKNIRMMLQKWFDLLFVYYSHFLFPLLGPLSLALISFSLVLPYLAKPTSGPLSCHLLIYPQQAPPGGQSLNRSRCRSLRQCESDLEAEQISSTVLRHLERSWSARTCPTVYVHTLDQGAVIIHSHSLSTSTASEP